MLYTSIFVCSSQGTSGKAGDSGLQGRPGGTVSHFNQRSINPSFTILSFSTEELLTSTFFCLFREIVVSLAI